MRQRSAIDAHALSDAVRRCAEAVLDILLRRVPVRRHEAVLSDDEIYERARKLVEQAGIRSVEEAYSLLDSGELDGTPLEVELRMLRFLKEGPRDPHSMAA